MKLKSILIGSFIFFIGVGVGTSGSKTPKTIIQEKVVTQEVPAKCDYSDWKSLKETDDRGFLLSAESMGLCSEGFDAASRLDVKSIDLVTAKMNIVSSELRDTATKRQVILKLLGY